MTKNLLLTMFILCCAAASALAASGIINTTNDVTLAATVQKQIIAANPGRKTVCCQNTGATNDARIGDAKTSATQGWHLDPDLAGSSGVCLDTDAAIFGYSTSGTTVGCNEVNNP